MTGLCLAAGFARAGVNVALVERARLADLSTDAFDGRGTAISAGSRRILEGVGLWSDIKDEAEPIREIRVADGVSPLCLHYDHADLDEGYLGWIVENAVIRRAFARAVVESGAEVIDGTGVTDATFDGVAARLALDNGETLSASLVIAADGRESPLRDMAGITVVRWRYPQDGIVCSVTHELNHRGIAHEHFLPAGPFAILPMTGNRSSIVWTERSDLAPEMMALDDAAFAAELRQRFGDFLGDVVLAPPRWRYPLSVVHARAYVAPRLALAGDAAHAIHPIAGQGFNIGLRDVAALSEITVDTLRLGLDPGAPVTLARYERWRRPDNMLMLAVTDSLNRLFSNDIAPLRYARDLGLATVDRAGPLKQFFMRQAMGLTGRLPRLARGEPL